VRPSALVTVRDIRRELPDDCDFVKFDRDTCGGATALSVEHVGGKLAVHLEAVRRSDALIEPQRGNSENLGQRGITLACTVVVQALLRIGARSIFPMPCRRTQTMNGMLKLRVISVVEPVERGKFVCREPIEPCAGLFALGVRGDRSLARGFAGKVGMSP